MQVFKKAYIPRTLDDVVDFEKDFRRVRHGETEEVGIVQSCLICDIKIQNKKKSLMKSSPN